MARPVVSGMTGPPRRDGDERQETRRRRAGWRRHWPLVRYLIGIGVLVLVVWVLSSHTDELSGLSTALDNLNWWWIPMAVVAEALSFVCFTGMEQKLLTSAGVVPPWFPLLRMTFASQAITNSLPAGSAVSAVYGFRWFRRFGADDTVAVWAMAGNLRWLDGRALPDRPRPAWPLPPARVPHST